MKKILISLSVIAAVAAIAVGGTIAYFSDTETSTGNTFTAGTLDLTKSAETSISLTNMKPGDSASGTITVNNVGSLPGFLYATSWYVDTDGTQPAEFPANMTRDDVAKKLLITAFTFDGENILAQIPEVDSNAGKSVFDMVNDPSGGSVTGYGNPTPPANATGGTKWYPYDTNMTALTGSHLITMTIQFDQTADNDYQADGITLTFEFLLTQK